MKMKSEKNPTHKLLKSCDVEPLQTTFGVKILIDEMELPANE